jgi:hypothetical protein
MNPLEEPSIRKHAQIPADRHVRYIQKPAQFSHRDGISFLDQLQDLLSPFSRDHDHSEYPQIVQYEVVENYLVFEILGIIVFYIV